MSWIPDEWERRVKSWMKMNQGKKIAVAAGKIPDSSREIFIYRSLIAAWPTGERERAALEKRLSDYVIKAAREARLSTNWITPDEDYESALRRFIASLLKDADFLADFAEFTEKLALPCVLSSLSQALLKIACPASRIFTRARIFCFSP